MTTPITPAGDRSTLPWRGPGDNRPAGLPLPPARMPLLHDRRPLKRWRYVGVFDERLMICAATVHVGGLAQSFWAIWDREPHELHERTSFGRAGINLADGRLALRRGGVAIDLTLEPGGDPVEVVSAHGASHIWTHKQWATACGTVTIDGRAHELAAPALIDDSAGYHARHTAWCWAAGAGVSDDGRALGWNLVTGIHDAPISSERTVWVDGVAQEAGPVTFADDLSSVRFATGEALSFSQEAVRERNENRGLVASAYRQPFGSLTGTLPDGLTLAHGLGVMERHTARW